MHGLERSTTELEKRLTLVEQYSRNGNFEIQGVVEVQEENVADLVIQIGSAIKEQILESDIESCRRVPTRHRGKSNIVVRFKSRMKRDETLQKAKKDVNHKRKHRTRKPGIHLHKRALDPEQQKASWGRESEKEAGFMEACVDEERCCPCSEDR